MILFGIQPVLTAKRGKFPTLLLGCDNVLRTVW